MAKTRLILLTCKIYATEAIYVDEKLVLVDFKVHPFDFVSILDKYYISLKECHRSTLTYHDSSFKLKQGLDQEYIEKHDLLISDNVREAYVFDKYLTWPSQLREFDDYLKYLYKK